MEMNEVMNEEMTIVETEPMIEETEKKDHSGAVGFALGSLLTLGVIAGVKKGKQLIQKRKAKKAEKASEVEEQDDKSDSESDE